MTAYVALLRAVNVGGTGKLPMAELKAMCEALGFAHVRTYIASGNLVFESDAGESTVKQALERALADYAGKPVGVLVRTGAEMSDVLAANPFAGAAPNRTVAIFLDAPPPADVLSGVSGRQDEDIAAGRREIYVHYRHGMADLEAQQSAAAPPAPARKINTIAKLRNGRGGSRRLSALSGCRDGAGNAPSRARLDQTEPHTVFARPLEHNATRLSGGVPITPSVVARRVRAIHPEANREPGRNRGWMARTSRATTELEGWIRPDLGLSIPSNRATL